MDYNNVTLKDKTLFVSSGDAAFSTKVDAYGQLYTVSGGVAYDTAINKYGEAFADTGGLFSNTQVNSDGALYILGGTASATTVFNGGSVEINSGAAYFTVVSSGGGCDTQVEQGTTIKSAGSAVSTTVLSGGAQSVESGGTDYATQVHAGGQESVGVGGFATGSVISAGGVFLLAGGYQYTGNFTETEGAYETIGTYSNGTETVANNSAGTTYLKTVSGGGTENVYSGGTLYETETQKGNELYTSQFTASGTMVYSSINYTYGAGSASDIAIMSGGTIILAGGHASGVHEQSGTIIEIGGSESATTTGVTYSGAIDNVDEKSINIRNGISATVYQTNQLESSTVFSGGFVQVLSGAVAIDDVVSSGGQLVLSAGAKATGITLIDGTETVFGEDDATVVSGTKFWLNTKPQGLLFVSSGGVASGATIYAGGLEDIYAGGVASDTVISGGFVYLSGGMLNGAVVYGGSRKDSGITNLSVGGGAVASDILLNKGAFEHVSGSRFRPRLIPAASCASATPVPPPRSPLSITAARKSSPRVVPLPAQW